MGIKFGPAGLGPVKTAEETLKEYARLGLKACEIAFTYSVYIKKKEDAIRIGKKAKELGISLSIHAQYFVNLNSKEKEKREATKERILKCCETGELLGAKTVVFHPGYYGSDDEKERENAYEVIKLGIEDIMKEIKKKKWKIEIAPETMGKINVFGSVEEISRLVKDTGCSFCIDYAHILARDKSVDYNKIERLFPGKNWHVHFSGIIYGEKGEKKHKSTEKKEWKELLKNIPKDKEIVIINESPTLVDDSVDGLKIWEEMN
jgi:deoxyribonuclease IV